MRTRALTHVYMQSVIHATMCMCESEGNSGFWVWTQTVGLGNKYLYPLSSLTNTTRHGVVENSFQPIFVFFSKLSFYFLEIIKKKWIFNSSSKLNRVSWEWPLDSVSCPSWPLDLIGVLECLDSELQDRPVSAYLRVGVKGMLPSTGFYVGAEGPSSGPHAHITLLTAPSLSA